MQAALIILACSIALLCCIAIIFRIEDARDGKRIVVNRIRNGFDWLLERSIVELRKMRDYVATSFLRLLFHYSVHKILKRMHTVTARLHARTERLLRQNKQVAKNLRTDTARTHLDEIADHKEETALSDMQKRKMRSH